MVTKMAKNNRLKIEKLLFRPNLRLLETDFFKNKISAQVNTKNPFNISCAVIVLIIC